MDTSEYLESSSPIRPESSKLFKIKDNGLIYTLEQLNESYIKSGDSIIAEFLNKMEVEQRLRAIVDDVLIERIQ